MKLLDLFSGAGGASTGYHRAGFEVTGVDQSAQRRYPFRFIQGDALEYLAQYGHEYDVIAASPPCQAHTAMRTMPTAKEHVDLIPQTRTLLVASGKPWVIENVAGAPLINPVVLCGSMFGLNTEDAQLRRHRLFETNWGFCTEDLNGMVCNHQKGVPTISVCGNGGGISRRRQAQGLDARMFPLADRKIAMGIDWMITKELSQAIPPAYTEFIGRALLNRLGAL